MTGELKPLAEFATDQHGNITVSQARAAGLTGRRLRQRVQDAVLERAGAHVLRSPFVECTALGDLAVLVLDIGDTAVVSGPTALAVHEFDGVMLQTPFHVTTLRGRNIDRPPHHIHTSTELPASDRTLVHGIPVMTPVRAIIDASRHLRSGPLDGRLDSGLRDRKYTEDMVHVRIVELAHERTARDPEAARGHRQAARRFEAGTAGSSDDSFRSAPATGFHARRRSGCWRAARAN